MAKMTARLIGLTVDAGAAAVVGEAAVEPPPPHPTGAMTAVAKTAAARGRILTSDLLD